MFKEQVDNLNKNWKYRYDNEQFHTNEFWTILKEAPYEGDCEDYSLTLLYNINNKSMKGFWRDILTFKAKMRFCRIGGEGHAVLQYDNMYIDNIQRKWTTREALEEKGYEFSRIPYTPVGVFARLYFIGRIKWQLK